MNKPHVHHKIVESVKSKGTLLSDSLPIFSGVLSQLRATVSDTGYSCYVDNDRISNQFPASFASLVIEYRHLNPVCKTAV